MKLTLLEKAIEIARKVGAAGDSRVFADTDERIQIYHENGDPLIAIDWDFIYWLDERGEDILKSPIAEIETFGDMLIEQNLNESFNLSAIAQGR